jgi:methionine-gamma-lyase
MSDQDHKNIEDFHPESLMMSYGYNPSWSEGAIKSPIFQTSTFVFETAEDGKAFFELALGKREKRKGEKIGLIYSRINNPDLEILENRLTVWDKAEEGAVFESGMASISTTLLELLEPGQFILHTDPVYGGTDHFIKHTLLKFGIDSLGISPEMNRDDILEMIDKSNCRDKVGMIFIETPANPTNALFDISMLCEVAKSLSQDEQKVYVVVDNTFLGPLWQHPLQLGADIVIYSATKYIGGHSDVIAGAALGSHELISRIKTLRSQLGSMGGPWTGWMLLRSLETLKIRMEKQLENARIVARFLAEQTQVLQVNYLGLLKEGTHYYDIVKKQCDAPGAMISFYLKGGEKEAFRFLNNLKLFKLAVSLGGTESLVEHPATMTHSPLSDEDRLEYGITDNMIRISIGVEHPDDLIRDLKQALAGI